VAPPDAVHGCNQNQKPKAKRIKKCLLIGVQTCALSEQDVCSSDYTYKLGTVLGTHKCGRILMCVCVWHSSEASTSRVLATFG